MDRKKASAILGIPFGTAQSRLSRMIMFDLLQRLDEDDCFRCGEKIANIKELSVEHKLPWRDDPELFWDLDNIAHSHISCNSREGAQRGNDPHQTNQTGIFAPEVKEKRTHGRWHRDDPVASCQYCMSSVRS